MIWIQHGLILWLTLVMPTAFAAATWTVNADEFPIGQGVDTLVDTSRTMTFEQARQALWDGQYTPEQRAIPNYGFTGHAYWFHFQAQTDGKVEGPWYFVMENPLVDHVDVYYQKDGQWMHKSSGDRQLFEQRDLKHRYFHFGVPLAEEPLEFFVRLQTLGASEFKMSFETKAAVMRKDHESQLIQGTFIGLMLIMISYYLLMAAGARSFEYFCLSWYWSSLLIFKLVMNGVAFEYLWPQSIWWGNQASAFTAPLVFLAAAFATVKFLPIKDFPRLQKVFYFFMTALTACCVGSFFLPYIYLKAYIVVGLCTSITILAGSIMTLRHGYKPARFFLLSWISMIVASVIYGLQKIGVLPVSFITVNCVEIGTGIQVLLMAIGASDKINEINRQIRRAQKAALEAQIEARRVTENMNVELERQVKERTQELWAQTKGMSVMLDSIHQGICTIDSEGAIHAQYSRYLETIIGTKGLAGKSLFEYLLDQSDLANDMKSQVRTAIAFAFGQDVMSFEGNLHLLPRQLRYKHAQQAKHLEIDWAAIEDHDGNVQKVLAAIRDVTAVKKAEEAAAAKQHELEIIGQILEIPASKFKRFLQSSRGQLDHCSRILENWQKDFEWHILLRNIHTIKGNARTYGFMEISRIVHDVETELFTFDPKTFKKENETYIQGMIKRIHNKLNLYETVHDKNLKRGDQAELEASLMRLFQLMGPTLEIVSQESRTQLAHVLSSLDKFNASTFCTLLKPVVGSLSSLAAQLGKKTPTVMIEGRDFYLDQAGQDRIEDIFVHMFRNSLDHGFTDSDLGHIQIRLEHEANTTRISYQDSGRGLNMAVLRKKGLERHLIEANASEDQVANLIFVSGISSAQKVTEISGRGVGMEAVKAFVAYLGGTLQLVLGGPGGTSEHRRFTLVIQLPAQNIVPERKHALAA
ncbi:7TM diverse intracellular signaling domain-containing protein [Oligoflexus tunisiensis]|uniref:7TM diverse intracellular signaling domain-containing protein n=1 Tax=Oligoflexus tunisiensis TaxID=708132 RepID=UPI00159F07E6|nr:7TM diverse intracellular signaling domain-containing protein [Oligoflexus tunisiensis]